MYGIVLTVLIGAVVGFIVYVWHQRRQHEMEMYIRRTEQGGYTGPAGDNFHQALNNRVSTINVYFPTGKACIVVLTPFAHQTVMLCFSSCPFYTENRIVVIAKDVQLSVISFYLTSTIEIPCSKFD